METLNDPSRQTFRTTLREAIENEAEPISLTIPLEEMTIPELKAAIDEMAEHRIKELKSMGVIYGDQEIS